MLGLRLITTLAIHLSRYVYYYRLIRIQSMVAVGSWTPLAIASLRYIFDGETALAVNYCS